MDGQAARGARGQYLERRDVGGRSGADTRLDGRGSRRLAREVSARGRERPADPRPRVQGWVSRASRSNERWAMDVKHIPCGQDGWGHLAAVIDCHDREVIGYELALRSWAKEAERAIEAACLQRFGTLRPIGAPVLRSDNGLIFQSRRFRQACQDYRLQQEFITPYTPEKTESLNGSFRSLKEECVWQHTFQTFEEARRIIREWVQWYNRERPHQALGYRSPMQYRTQQSTQVA